MFKTSTKLEQLAGENQKSDGILLWCSKKRETEISGTPLKYLIGIWYFLALFFAVLLSITRIAWQISFHPLRISLWSFMITPISNRGSTRKKERHLNISASLTPKAAYKNSIQEHSPWLFIIRRFWCEFLNKKCGLWLGLILWGIIRFPMLPEREAQHSVLVTRIMEDPHGMA